MSKNTKSRESQVGGRRWTQWREPEARKALAEWRQSGLSAAAFCAREGYSQTRLRYWSERLGEEQSAQATSVSFVPVAWEDARQDGQIEIEHVGVVVRVREGLDVEHVARLVAALASRRPTC